MTSFGIPQEDIARVIGMDSKTLRKHFREELDTGVTKANSRVAQCLFETALGGNTTAQIFWLKTRAHWKETVHIDQDIRGEITEVRRTIVDPKGHAGHTNGESIPATNGAEPV